MLAAVNAKLYLEWRASWQPRCLPEAEVAQGRAWLFLVELSPAEGAQHSVYRCPEGTGGIVDTGSVEEVKLEAFLEELRGIACEQE